MFDGTLTYDPQSKYDVPAGVYDVQFVGVEERKPFDNPGKFGRANPNEKRLGWLFKIISGELAGKVIEQGTGSTLAPKTKVLGLVTMMLGRQLAKGEQVDPRSMIGFTYRLAWSVNPDSEQGRNHVSSLTPLSRPTTTSNTAPTNSTTPTSAPAGNGAAASAAPPPPPPSQRPPTPPDTDGGPFWVVEVEGQPPVQRDRAWIEARIKERNLDPRTVQLCPNGKQTWAPAASFGFADPVPY
jgi:hypothetical protein